LCCFFRSRAAIPRVFHTLFVEGHQKTRSKQLVGNSLRSFDGFVLVAAMARNLAWALTKAEQLRKCNRKSPEYRHVDVCHLDICSSFHDLCSTFAGNTRYLVHRDISKSMTEAEEENIIRGAKEKLLASYPTSPALRSSVEISGRQYVFFATTASGPKRGRPLVCITVGATRYCLTLEVQTKTHGLQIAFLTG
jgi:hypothetical protein